MSDKKLQAKHLFFQTDLNKTQIAEILHISRRTLHYWIREGNWERLKRSSEHMPSLIAENCYHIMAHLTNSYLSERRLTNPVSPKEIDALHKLVLTINKLKTRSALNEHIETFGYFIDRIRQKAPDVAEQVAPFVEEYLEERAMINAGDFTPPHFNDMGYIPMGDKTDYTEQQLDNHDFLAWDTDGLIFPTAQEPITSLIPQPVAITGDVTSSSRRHSNDDKGDDRHCAEQSVGESVSCDKAISRNGSPSCESNLNTEQLHIAPHNAHPQNRWDPSRVTSAKEETPEIQQKPRATSEQEMRNARPVQNTQPVVSQINAHVVDGSKNMRTRFVSRTMQAQENKGKRS